MILSRRWLRHSVLVLAALASIATSKKKGWELEAQLPAEAVDATKPLVLSIEASQMPVVKITNGLSSQPIDAEHEPDAWPATLAYLVPAGWRLENVWVGSSCGGSCESCSRPDDAFVKVTTGGTAATWTRQAESSPITTVLAPDTIATFLVRVGSSRGALVVTSDGVAPAVATVNPVNSEIEGRYHFEVTWQSRGSREPVTFTWTAKATIQGACPSGGDCKVPTADYVRIMGVDSRPVVPATP